MARGSLWTFGKTQAVMLLRRFIHSLSGLIIAGALLASPASARNFTAKDLVMLDRLSDPQLSPDGASVVYDLRTTDFAANRAKHALWIIGTKQGSQPRLLSAEGSGPRWSPDGAYVYFN